MFGAVMTLSTSCTQGSDGASPTVTGKADTAATSNASGTPPASPGTVTTSSTASPALDTAFPSSPQPLWREHPGAGPGTFDNRDSTVHAGSYRLEVICLGGSVGINVDGVRQRDLECSRQVESIPICVKRTGLRVSAEWIRGPFDDLAWQLVPHDGVC